MSHVDTIQFQEEWDIDTLKQMCKAEGWLFHKGQKTYRWWGRHVGDYPIPEGFTKEDMGKCDHAISIPGAIYEIGIVNRNGKVHLLWDFYRTGGLQVVLGDKAGKLKQAYTLAKARKECRKRRLRFKENWKLGFREFVIEMEE